MNTNKPKPPEHLNASATQVWEQLCNALEDVGLLHKSDAALIELTALIYCEHRQAQVLIKAEGITVQCNGRYGTSIKRHPAHEILSSAQLRLIRALTQLGLSPVARKTHLGIVAEPESELAKLSRALHQDGESPAKKAKRLEIEAQQRLDAPR
ncbi:MAG: phage terminase small subunit P27 family [Verrucomicrobia bacterium]|jgi:P27 family predicted phage terminase small subunit|nr:phage terminase small subunit P27 family [Verrucomicrobiota bacterium]